MRSGAEICHLFLFVNTFDDEKCVSIGAYGSQFFHQKVCRISRGVRNRITFKKSKVVDDMTPICFQGDHSGYTLTLYGWKSHL